VKDLVADKGKRLLVNVNDLRRKNAVRATRFVCFASSDMQTVVLRYVVTMAWCVFICRGNCDYIEYS
jgi:hypothetical protein